MLNSGQMFKTQRVPLGLDRKMVCVTRASQLGSLHVALRHVTCEQKYQARAQVDP